MYSISDGEGQIMNSWVFCLIKCIEHYIPNMEHIYDSFIYECRD